LTAGLAVSVPAPAQSIADVQHALAALEPRVKQLDTADRNLGQMESALNNIERDALNRVLSAKSNFYVAVDEARSIARILVNMTSPEDTRYVRSEFRESIRFVTETTRTDLERVNFYLTQLTTPAVMAEATKIRDLMIEIRDILKSFAVKE
jgi:signal recognition particle subunit SEC65